MAITFRTRILVWAMADGESTSFVFDLFKSQFRIGTAQPSGFGGHSPNFFIEKAAYDPDTVGELPIKYALNRIANPRDAAKARLANKK
jgi:hypothetical protein